MFAATADTLSLLTQARQPRYALSCLAQRHRTGIAEAAEYAADEVSAPGQIETLHVEETVGRNDPCPCGSGKKYKKCCLP